ncbi:hypothetical protein JYK14_09805 [Siccirubricoccus sp. KC 17139]|uniref:Uncharacterized protein n=1 Tax=Siccirubricoccus soli TaxID=2899147 RepID=A0ABT1D632_9PROT|nr:hypothetical protein [Siccirubricoccus soli]MCO6416460.1 hypothetical protein [Siccirubricoccus soli]MCP2682594.1 hypothetical protein [Siccirubricoccus soli]
MATQDELGLDIASPRWLRLAIGLAALVAAFALGMAVLSLLDVYDGRSPAKWPRQVTGGPRLGSAPGTSSDIREPASRDLTPEGEALARILAQRAIAEAQQAAELTALLRSVSEARLAASLAPAPSRDPVIHRPDAEAIPDNAAAGDMGLGTRPTALAEVPPLKAAPAEGPSFEILPLAALPTGAPLAALPPLLPLPSGAPPKPAKRPRQLAALVGKASLESRTPAPVALAAGPRVDSRCGPLLARLQLGEGPTDADRALLHSACATRP